MTATAMVPERLDSREDRLLGGRVRLSQPARGYRVAIDPLLLAAAAAVTAGQRVLDLGCGSGAASLCLLARQPQCRLVGLELQPELAALARRNAAANGCADRFRVIEGDVTRMPEELAGSFDQVICNPPFLDAGEATPPAVESRATAHHETHGELSDWLDAALASLKPKGTLTVIQRADRLDDLLAALRGRAGGLRLLPLWPKAGRPAKRIIVSARKGSRAPLALLPGLILHEADGRFTAAAEAVLRDAAPLPLT